MSEHFDILKLAELLRPPNNDNSDEENEIPKPRVHAIDATNLNLSATNENVAKPKENVAKPKENVVRKEDEYEDWDPDEMARKYMEKECPQATTDWKKTPQWDVFYRQNVTSSDVFLQMGGKTPSTASCEEMVLSIYLPGENRQSVDLKITRDRLDLVSPNFKLDIPLPHPVDPQRGNAQFDADSEKLIVTLVLDREFDYINF